jgi:hypothetical protein
VDDFLASAARVFSCQTEGGDGDQHKAGVVFLDCVWVNVNIGLQYSVSASDQTVNEGITDSSND